MDIIGALFGLALIAIVLGIAYVFIDEFVVPFIPLVILVPIGILVATKIWRTGHDNIVVLVAIGFGAVAYVSQNHWIDYLSERCSKAKYKCPKCGSAETVNHDSKTDTYSTTRTETRRTTHFGKDGEEKGYSEHDVEVPYTAEAVTLYMRCEKCSHEWTAAKNGYKTKTPRDITLTALVAIAAVVVIANFIWKEWTESELPSNPGLNKKQKTVVASGQQKPPLQSDIRPAAKPPVGTWAGTVNQPGFGSYSATMKLKGAGGGSVDLSIGCGGSLSFTGERNGSFYYTGRITYGKNKCINGSVEVRPSGDAVYYEWSDGKSKASGTLNVTVLGSAPEQRPIKKPPEKSLRQKGHSAASYVRSIEKDSGSARFKHINDKYPLYNEYKAIAISTVPNERWGDSLVVGYAYEYSSQEEANERAIYECNRKSRGKYRVSGCELYAIGDKVVQ